MPLLSPLIPLIDVTSVNLTPGEVSSKWFASVRELLYNITVEAELEADGDGEKVLVSLRITPQSTGRSETWTTRQNDELEECGSSSSDSDSDASDEAEVNNKSERHLESIMNGGRPTTSQGEPEEGEVVDEETYGKENSEESGYELLVDYELRAAGVVKYVESDVWTSTAVLEQFEIDAREWQDAEGAISFSLRIREILAPFNLHRRTSYRSFRVLSSTSAYYVNTEALNQLGGDLFAGWYAKECEGEDTTVVVQSIDAAELDSLLKACCRYSMVIIHRGNFRQVLELADRYRIVGLLRYLENYLLESGVIHKIRKLEYALEYRMSRLADHVLRSFQSRTERLDTLFDYLNSNGETLELVHPDLLKLFEIYNGHIVL